MSESQPNVTEAPHPAPRVLWIVLLSVMALAIVARLIPSPRTIDDAFITFRYSRNIVDGSGFVYNPGTRTLGTTTPLYTLLMASIGALTGSGAYPWFALIVNALADAATAALLGWLAFRLTGRLVLAAVLGVLWSISPMSVTFAVGGMETSVALLWQVAAFALVLGRRERAAAAVAALAILTRIDTVIWVGPLLAHQAWTHWRASRGARRWHQRLPWPSWAVFGAVLAPWYAFSWAYFGTLLSRSLSAKSVAYVVDGLQATTRLLQHIATPFLDHETLGVPGIVIGIVLYPALAGVGTLFVAKQHARLLPWMLYPWLYVIAFSVINPLIFRWYLAPLLPAYFLAIVLGVWALADSITTALKRPRALPVALGVIGLALAGLSLNAWTLHPDHGPDRPAPSMAWHEIELHYREMGELLRDEYGVTAGTTVAAGDIGAVGYYSRAHIVDTVGLVTPELSAYYPLDRAWLVDGENYAVPPAIVFDTQPDYIVFMEMFVRNGLMSETYRDAFVALYDQERFIPTDFYGNGMLLYKKHTPGAPAADD